MVLIEFYEALPEGRYSYNDYLDGTLSTCFGEGSLALSTFFGEGSLS